MSNPETASDFNPFNPTDLDSRYVAMEQMRNTCPVTPIGDRQWYAATHAGVLTGLKNVDKFVGSFIDTSKLPPDEVMISAIPEPRHGKIRRVINSVMAPHRTMHAEGFIRELAVGLLDDAIAKGRSSPDTQAVNPQTDNPEAAQSQAASFDLIDEYVDPIPSAVIAHVLGVPTEDFQKFRRWSDELLENQNADLNSEGVPKTMSQGHPEFAAYIQHQIDIRRAALETPDDLIGRFIGADIEGEPLSDDMIRTQTMFLIIAGNETTRNWLGNYLTTLAYDPQLYAKIKNQPDIREKFMEESLRRDCPVQIVARAATQDTVIEGQSVPQGDQVVFGIASANRDEAVFENPADFNFDRSDLKKHLAFGAGPHICPGASLARLEARVALDVFCERVSSFSVQAGYEFQYNPVFWALGLRSLPVEVISEP